MKNVTILIQGKITQETYNFYVESCPQYPIVISTWSNNQLDLSYFPHNLRYGHHLSSSDTHIILIIIYLTI